MEKLKKFLNSSAAKSLLVLGLFAFSITALGAWTQPESNPPSSSNVYAPLNVGGDTQSKIGSLIVGGFSTPIFYMTDGASAGKVLTAVDATGYATWQSVGSGSVPSGNSGETLRHDGSGWASNNFLYNNGSAIGIGTQSPNEQLELTGNLRLPATSSSSAGIIFRDGQRFIHNFGTNNSFFGALSGNYSLTGNNNTAVGRRALQNLTTGALNVAIGNDALYVNADGNNNVAIGNNAMVSNESGGQNMALGRNALKNNLIGSSNVAIGYQAGANSRSGDSSVFIGAGADRATLEDVSYSDSLDDLVVIGTDSVARGDSAVALGANSSVQGSNSMALGPDITVTGDNKIRIGNDSVVEISGKVTWTSSSDKRFKKDIKDLDLGLDFINSLRPVSYQMKTETDGVDSFGFIAQEVEEVLGNREARLVSTEDTEEAMKYMRYDDLIAPLVKAVQEQQDEIEALKKEIEILKNK